MIIAIPITTTGTEGAFREHFDCQGKYLLKYPMMRMVKDYLSF